MVDSVTGEVVNSATGEEVVSSATEGGEVVDFNIEEDVNIYSDTL